MKGFISAIAAIFIGHSITPQASAPSKPVAPLAAEEIVKKLQKFYDDTKDYQARFNQVYTYKAYGRKQKSSGKVYFKKNNKMRWEYTKPTTKYFISDGVDFWAYEPEEAQAYKVPLADSQVPTVLTFLAGKGKLLDEFNPKLLSGDKRATDPSDYVVELTPKKAETEYKSVVMVVSSADFSLKSIYVYDPVDNENFLSFSKASINKGINDSQFSFSPPASVKIINPPSSESE
jgi:outer membrane lipoprotein carrier protein